MFFRVYGWKKPLRTFFLFYKIFYLINSFYKSTSIAKHHVLYTGAKYVISRYITKKFNLCVNILKRQFLAD